MKLIDVAGQRLYAHRMIGSVEVSAKLAGTWYSFAITRRGRYGNGRRFIWLKPAPCFCAWYGPDLYDGCSECGLMSVEPVKSKMACFAACRDSLAGKPCPCTQGGTHVPLLPEVADQPFWSGNWTEDGGMEWTWPETADAALETRCEFMFHGPELSRCVLPADHEGGHVS